MLEQRLVLDSAFLGSLEFHSPAATFSNGFVSSEVQVGFAAQNGSEFQPLLTLPGGVQVNPANNTAIINSSFRVGGVNFEGNDLAFTFDTANNRFILNGGASISVGGAAIAMSFGAPGTDEDGLILQNGALTQLNATVNADFSFKKLEVAVQDVAFTYRQADDYFAISGDISVATTGESEDSSLSLAATLGDGADRAGMVIQNGQVTGVFIVVNGGFTLKGYSLEAENLVIDYSRMADQLQLSGGVTVMLNDKLTVHAAISDQTPLVIDTATGELSVGGSGLTISGALKVGPFDAMVDLSYSQDPATGLSLEADVLVHLPQEIDVSGRLVLVSGRLSEITLAYTNTGEGKPIGATGFFLTGMSGSLRNLDDPDLTNLMVRGSIDIRFGKKVLGEDLLSATGTFELDKHHLELNAMVDLLGGKLGTANGRIDINWTTGVFLVDADLELVGGLVRAHGTLHLDRRGNVTANAGISFNVPDSLPFGGTRLASGELYVQVRPDKPASQSFVRVYGSIFNFEVGFEFDFDGNSKYLGRQWALTSEGCQSEFSCYRWERQFAVDESYDYLAVTVTSPFFKDPAYSAQEKADDFRFQQPGTTGVRVVFAKAPNGELPGVLLDSSFVGYEVGGRKTGYVFDLGGYGDDFGNFASCETTVPPRFACIEPARGTDTITLRVPNVTSADVGGDPTFWIDVRVQSLLPIQNVGGDGSERPKISISGKYQPSTLTAVRAVPLDETMSKAKLTVEGSTRNLTRNQGDLTHLSVYYKGTYHQGTAAETEAVGLIRQVEFNKETLPPGLTSTGNGGFTYEFEWDGLASLSDTSQIPYDAALQPSFRFYATIDDQTNRVEVSDDSTDTLIPPNPATQFTSSPPYAINAGGMAYSKGQKTFSFDTVPDSPLRTAANAYVVDTPIDMSHPSIPVGTPMEVFQSERWDEPGDSEMKWSLPVPPGDYQVRLYFSEIFYDNPGQRVFDVAIEGQQVLNDYDIVADVGARKGVVKTFVVSSDELLDIEFGHVVDRPKIAALEVQRILPDHYRANAGGPEVYGQPVWVSDEALSVYRNDSSNAATYPDNVNSFHFSVPAGTPSIIFKSERWDPAGGEEMSYDFPVANGDYTVRLYFAENFVGDRIFSVDVEGNRVLSDFVLLEQANGFHNGIAGTFPVSVVDGNLDIDFYHVSENPLVHGIEIIRKARIPNDDFADAAPITPNRLVEIDISGGTREPGEPAHGSPANGNPNTVWYRWTAPDAGPVSVTTRGSDFQTALGIYTGSTVSNLANVASNVEPFPNAGYSELEFAAQVGVTYYIALAGFGPFFGNADLALHFEETVEPPIRSEKVDVTLPNDRVLIVNGINDGDTEAGPPPTGEEVENAIDDTTGKYLNFRDLGSGFIVEPNVGATIVDGLRIYTANDQPDRDPASFRLEGSNNGVDYQLIAQSELALPSQRNPAGLVVDGRDGLWFQEVSFPNDTPYTSYRLTFPTLKNAAATNSMQVGEVELLAPVVAPDPVIYRINAAGPELTDDPLWVADAFNNPLPYHNQASTFSTVAAIDLNHPSIPAGTPMAMFQTQRYKQPTMEWDLPVDPGTYEVRLYMAELYYDSPGRTVFDVSIEGIVVLEDFDLLATVGKYEGIMKRFFITSDANLDIDFVSIVNDPIVNGIEIVRWTAPQLSGDFEPDGDLDGDDVDALVSAIVAGGHAPAFDLTGDGSVTADDLNQWLILAGAHNLPSRNAYLPGDANLDGIVDASDLTRWSNNRFTNTAQWTRGDFDADGQVDVTDFNLWNQNKYQSVLSNAEAGAVVNRAGRIPRAPIFGDLYNFRVAERQRLAHAAAVERRSNRNEKVDAALARSSDNDTDDVTTAHQLFHHAVVSLAKRVGRFARVAEDDDAHHCAQLSDDVFAHFGEGILE